VLGAERRGHFGGEIWVVVVVDVDVVIIDVDICDVEMKKSIVNSIERKD
jgi:hypothetical protein